MHDAGSSLSVVTLAIRRDAIGGCAPGGYYLPLRDTGIVAIVAAVVGSRQEAELIVGMLKSHGIRAASSADDAGGVDLALQAQGVRVLVPEADISKARSLLQNESAAGREPNRFQRVIIRLLGGSAKG